MTFIKLIYEDVTEFVSKLNFFLWNCMFCIFFFYTMLKALLYALYMLSAATDLYEIKKACSSILSHLLSSLSSSSSLTAFFFLLTAHSSLTVDGAFWRPILIVQTF